jgi:hypothetical protein
MMGLIGDGSAMQGNGRQQRDVDGGCPRGLDESDIDRTLAAADETPSSL